MKAQREELREQLNTLLAKENVDKKMVQKIKASIAVIDQKEKRFNKVKNYFLKNKTEVAADETMRQLCCVLSYYFYGMSEGKINMNFSDFYIEQVQKGNINLASNGNGAVLFYGSSELENEWGGKNWGRVDVQYDKQKIDETLSKIKGTTAIAWTGGHFYILKKNGNDWYFMDHYNDNRRYKKITNVPNYWTHIKEIRGVY